MTTPSLTPTEERITRLIVAGKRRRADIALAMHMSTKTVQTHLSSLYRKYAIPGDTKAKMFTLAVRLGVDEEKITPRGRPRLVCSQCGQRKKSEEFRRLTNGPRGDVCLDCYRASETKQCARCKQTKPLLDFHTGRGYSLFCHDCAAKTADKDYIPVVENKLPSGVALGELVTWQYSKPAHLPPIELSGKVVGSVAGRLVAEVAGAWFVVGG